jgi:phage tail-like protein
VVLMRAGLTGLSSPHPLTTRLPAVLQDDDFTVRFVSGLDDVLAPVFATLDSLSAYLDPELTPADYLPWLASWVALELDDAWREPEQRALIRHAVGLHQWRGTRRGVVEQVRLAIGDPQAEVEVVDSGGCAFSTEPGGTLPGDERAGVQVTVRVADPATVDRRRLREAVAAAAPAHLPAEVEVVVRP